tara:strand:- start:316 stop:939 length:624 start_codon:yes stop_codon:yes gene_type:complete
MVFISLVFQFYIKGKFLITTSLVSFLLLIVLSQIINESASSSLLMSSLEGNSIWRINIWIQNIRYLLDNTYGVGVGLGSSYFLSDLIPAGEYWKTFHSFDNYMGNAYHEDYVTGQHNSLINIFYRFGFVGIILFLGFIFQIHKKIETYMLPNQYHLILIVSIITICVNVGLESPKFAMFFVFCVSLVISEIYQKEFLYNIDKNKILN